RARRSASWATASGRILIATSRDSLVSRARYTSPMPPAPSGAVISYAPRREPAVSVMKRDDYTDRKPLQPRATRKRQACRSIYFGIVETQFVTTAIDDSKALDASDGSRGIRNRWPSAETANAWYGNPVAWVRLKNCVSNSSIGAEWSS